MTKRNASERVNIISGTERQNNLAIIDACAHGLHFIYVRAKYKVDGSWGGMGYATLVYNGRTVSYDPDDTSATLVELNDQNYIMGKYDDDEIPDAFLPHDLFEQALFNSWRQ